MTESGSGELQIAVGSVLLGTIPIFSALLRDEGVSSLVQTHVRIWGTAIFVAVYLVLSRRALPMLRRGRLFLFAVYGLFGIAATHFTLTSAVACGTPVAEVTFLANAQPMFTLLLAWIVLKERLVLRKVLAALVAIAGALMLAEIWHVGGFGFHSWGDAFALSNGFLYSVYVTFTRRLRHADLQPGEILLWGFVLAGIWLIPLSICLIPVFGTSRLTSMLFVLTWRTAVFLAALVIVSTAVPYCLLVDGLRKVEASRAAPILVLEPVSAAILGYAVLGEVVGMWQLLGGGLVIAAALLASSSKPGPRHAGSELLTTQPTTKIARGPTAV